MIYKIPLNDDVIVAISRLVDDSQTDRRNPSHSDIDFQIQRFNLQKGDPKANGHNVGKAKRVRSVLSWALEYDSNSGEELITALLNLVKGLGGFRETSSNYVGKESIRNLHAILKGYSLHLDKEGNLSNLILDNLSELEMEEALWNYVRRAKKGEDDAALLTGTSKDLLEAVAAHVLVKLWGSYPQTVNFPTLLGQAFVALGLTTSLDGTVSNSPADMAKRKMEVKLYELGCSINMLRNKAGTGHGRPFFPEISDDEAKLAIESMAVISEYLLRQLKKN